ncbi:hypothetical protein AMTRI_Chr06g192130 [Amborella trichopoda]
MMPHLSMKNYGLIMSSYGIDLKEFRAKVEARDGCCLASSSALAYPAPCHTPDSENYLNSCGWKSEDTFPSLGWVHYETKMEKGLRVRIVYFMIRTISFELAFVFFSLRTSR